MAERINADGYIEVPETLVASAATLVSTHGSHSIVNIDYDSPEKIYGLLRRDTSPLPEGGWKFSTDTHHSTYAKHIKSLNHLKDQNDVGYSVLLANIYRKARFVDCGQIFHL